MAIIYTNVARKGLKKMPAKDRAALMAKLDAYAASGQGDVKPLVGSSFFRMRHGDWRAVFEIEDGILVVKVAHRREVYK
jgi:mRNA interferase RelE/StbE